MAMPALTTAMEPGSNDAFPGRQVVEGRIGGIDTEPPAHGALGVVWVSTVPGSSSILDVRGLVLWPGTAIVTPVAGGWRPAEIGDLLEGRRVRARVSDQEYWSIPPIFDAARIEILGR